MNHISQVYEEALTNLKLNVGKYNSRVERERGEGSEDTGWGER